MHTLARLISNRLVAWVTVIGVLLLAGASIKLAMEVEREDDILAFLPPGDPDVKLFHRLNEQFGGLDVALIGIDAGAGRSVLEPAFVERLMSLTDTLQDTAGLDQVLSLTNVTDFVPDRVNGGIITGPLIHAVPRTPAAERQLREHVMSRDHVVGNFIARDGRATLIYGFLAHGSDPRTVAASLREVVSRAFPDHDKYWGGSPFISAYIFNSTLRDMRRLTPWAVLAMVIVMMIAFRDLIGTCLALLSTSFGIVMSMAVMKLFDERMNIVLGSMPVILFAVGSAYGIHILARYYGRSGDEPRSAAITATLTSAGPTVIAAGLTTVVSLLSFLTMDLRPMRVFGLFTGLGVLLTLLLSVTFIPAVLRLVAVRRKARERAATPSAGGRLLRALALFGIRRRALAGVLLGLVTAVATLAVLRVENRIDPSNLFAEGSPPDRADRFLQRHFGGSAFLQLHVKGKLGEPLALRRLQWIADRVRFFPGVSSVLHAGDVVSRANEAMEGQRRVPDTAAKIGLLLKLVSGDPSVRQLITNRRDEGLIQVKLATSDGAKLERVLAAVEGWVADEVNQELVVAQVGSSGPARARLERMVVDRIRAGLAAEGVSFDDAAYARLRAALALPSRPVDQRPVVERLRRFLRSEECAVKLPPATAGGDDPALKLARALAPLGPRPPEERLTRTIAAALDRPPADETVEDLSLSVGTPLREIGEAVAAEQRATRMLAHAGIALPAGSRGKRCLRAVAAATLDLRIKRVLVPRDSGAPAVAGAAPRRLVAAVNGLPAIHRSLARSALRNQVKSLSTALVPVILIMALLFRSLRAGLLVATPTMITLLLVYGGMGVLGVQLDIGTAMLACIILGAGVDYAVHLVAAWRAPEGGTLADAASRAVDATGTAIWTNALTVCIGFAVLTVGEARPLQNVGGLTAVAMIAAALATFVAIPTLARRTRYGHKVNLPRAEQVPRGKREEQEEHLARP